MRLITVFELSTRSEIELRVLFRKASEATITTEPGSAKQNNARQTLDNIARAMRIRRHPKP